MSAVSEIMSQKVVVTVDINDNPSALDVAKLMAKHSIGSVIVIEGDEKKPVGIVTERDILRRSLPRTRVRIKLQSSISCHPRLSQLSRLILSTQQAERIAENKVESEHGTRAGWLDGWHIINKRYCKKAGKNTD